MLEEEKVVAEEPKEEEALPAQQENVNNTGLDAEGSASNLPTNGPTNAGADNGRALASFILAAVASCFAFAWSASLVAVVTGIVSLAIGKNVKDTTQPYSTFMKIARPVAIACIPIGAVMFLIFLIVTIVQAAQAAQNANALIALFF